MISLRDCVSGECVSLGPANSILPGRYALIKNSNLGIHGSWPPGTVLFDDGRGKIEIDGDVLRFASTSRDIKRNAKKALVYQALEELSNFIDLEQVNSLPSPAIPPQIARSIESTQLEVELAEILQEGHLHSIAKSPRFTMRYDEELLPVSRVKRTSSGYQQHLAAHSDCWYQRTFTGIIPKKLKANISEDEYNIYENRVFARFLDHIERFLQERLAKLRLLTDVLSEGINFDQTIGVDHRLRSELCKIWGESFEPQNAESIKARSETQLHHFEDQLQSILKLKQSSTYRAIPRSALVPIGLKSTNILLNDPHYRKLRHLWELWVNEVAANKMDHVKIFKQRQSELENYVKFNGLLILRASFAIGFDVDFSSNSSWQLSHPSGITAMLELTSAEWMLSIKQAVLPRQLVFAPLLLDEIEDTGNSHRIAATILTESNTKHTIYASPDNLYSEEIYIKELQAWLGELIVSHYGNQIDKLPTVITEHWLEKTETNRFKDAGQISEKDYNNWLKKFNLSKQEEISIHQSFLAAKFISYCPCCGQKVSPRHFSPRDDRGFMATCTTCSADWQVRYTGQDWVYQIGKNLKQAQNNGRWQLNVTL